MCWVWYSSFMCYSMTTVFFQIIYLLLSLNLFFQDLFLLDYSYCM